MCIYTYLCISMYTYVCVYVCGYEYEYICIYLYIYIHLCLYIYIYAYICIYLYAYVYMYVCYLMQDIISKSYKFDPLYTTVAHSKQWQGTLNINARPKEYKNLHWETAPVQHRRPLTNSCSAHLHLTPTRAVNGGP